MTDAANVPNAKLELFLFCRKSPPPPKTLSSSRFTTTASRIIKTLSAEAHYLLMHRTLSSRQSESGLISVSAKRKPKLKRPLLRLSVLVGVRYGLR